MNDYLIAVPSYNRVDGIKDKTLNTLHKYNIPNEKIIIFVNTEEQKKEYEEKIPKNLYGKIIATKQEKGIKNVRNFIVDYFPMNQKFISMDDDVIAFQQVNSKGKLVNIKNLKELIKDGFGLCDELNYTLWGLYPVANGFYMKGQKPYTTDLRFIVGGFMGIINKKRKVHLDWKEDYELSLEAYVKDGGVVRFNRVCVNHHLYTKTGGIGKSQEERMNDYKRSAKWLIKKYPQLVKPNPNREGEILLKKGEMQGEGYECDTDDEIEGGKIKNLDNIPVDDFESTKVILDSIDQTNEIKDIQKRLIELLESTSIPRIEGKRKDKRKTRGDLIGYDGFTFTLGVGRRRQLGIGEFKTNERNPELLKVAIEYGNKILPTGFKYSVITINKNLKAKRHIDGGNNGFGAITFLGDFTGGGLYIYDNHTGKPKLYNTHNKLIIFNGANLEHKTEDFKGTRYALIYYTQVEGAKIKGFKTQGEGLVQKSDIPVSQIFIDFGKGKSIDDYKLFKCSMNRYKQLTSNYTLYDDKKADALMKKYPEFYDMYKNVKYPVMKVDILRFMIVYDKGGFYSDLDVLPMTNNLKKETEKGFTIWSYPDLFGYDVIYSPKGNEYLLDFLRFVKKQIEEKDKVKIYDKWKARYVLHTTGPKAFSKFMKQNPNPNLHIAEENSIITKKDIEDTMKNKDKLPFISLIEGSWLEKQHYSKDIINERDKIKSYFLDKLKCDD
jgi:hypothetical protein